MGGREERSRGVAFWEESYPWAQRSKTETLSESNQPRWGRHQRGISPSMIHIQRECHPRAGETCTSYNDGAAFATTPFEINNFRGSFDRRQMAAGDDRVCELGATRGPIRLLRCFNGGSRHQRRVIRPSHFGALWRLNRHWLVCHRRGLVHFLILDESVNVRL